MSSFKYSKSEKELNKVIKMNLDKSKELLNSKILEKTRKVADKNIQDSLDLLKELNIEPLFESISSEKEPIFKKEPVLQEWEELVNKSNEEYKYEVIIEDFMTPEEIDNIFIELQSIESKFSEKTSLFNRIDLSFLAIATAIQVSKSLLFPYVAKHFNYGESFDPSQRKQHNDKDIKKQERDVKDKYKNEKIQKNGKGYWINILYQSVPYDAINGSKELGLGLGGKNHRLHTLGHDPILGWIFGTLNILTDTITFNDFSSNRVNRKPLLITEENVFLGKIFKESYQMINDDYLNLPTALLVQAQHIESDKYTKMGLPVPILSVINEKFSSALYKENYDYLCFSRDMKIIGASFVVSRIFDMIISLIHGFFREEGMDKKIFEVRTRKILLISNIIASSSTIINSSITSNPKNLDIGTLLNTIARLFSDTIFINKIKQEYIDNEIYNQIENELKRVDDLMEELTSTI